MDDNELRGRLAAMEARIEPASPPSLAPRKSRHLGVSLVAAPLLILAVAGTAVAGAIIAGQAHGYPGVENLGQPLAGVQMECMTPPQAAAAIAAHGIASVQWQIERDDPTTVKEGRMGSTSTIQATAPATGLVVPGAIVDGTLLMVVDQRSGAVPAGHCDAK